MNVMKYVLARNEMYGYCYILPKRNEMRWSNFIVKF